MKDKKRRLRTVEDAVGAKMGRLIPWFPDRGEPEPEAGPGDVILTVVYEDLPILNPDERQGRTS